MKYTRITTLSVTWIAGESGSRNKRTFIITKGIFKNIRVKLLFFETQVNVPTLIRQECSRWTWNKLFMYGRPTNIPQLIPVACWW